MEEELRIADEVGKMLEIAPRLGPSGAAENVTKKLEAYVGGLFRGEEYRPKLNSLQRCILAAFVILTHVGSETASPEFGVKPLEYLRRFVCRPTRA